MPGTLTRRNFLSLDFGDRRAAGDHWVRVHRVAMACRFEVMLSALDAINVEAARAALDMADEIESVLAVHRDGSEAAVLNRRAAGESVVASPDLFAVLSRSAELNAATRGAFDVTAAPLSRCWGLLRGDGHLPTDDDIAKARRHVGMQHVTMDPSARRVAFTHDGVELDFGGIGKGYALDRMGDILRRRGARRALLSAGRSSGLAIGGRGRGWPIDLGPGLGPAGAGRLWLRDGAVGTSGRSDRFMLAGGRRFGRVIDPGRGRPAEGVLAASVVTHDAASADALSTAFLVGGPALAQAYCDAHAETMAILTLDDGEGTAYVCGGYDGATVETPA